MIYFYDLETLKDFGSNIARCNFQECIDYFKDKEIIQVDTETEGFFDFKNRILTIQLGDYKNQYVLAFRALTAVQKDELNTLIFKNPAKKKLFQNAKFDIKFLWLEGFDICNVYDTMLAEQILHTGIDTEEGFHSLYGLCVRYCNIKLDKSIRGEINKFGLSPVVIEYAANDVKYLEIIREQQLKKLIDLSLASQDDQDIYTILGLENNVVIVFADMEYNGMLLDVKKWKEIELLLENKIKVIENELNSFVWNNNLFKKYRNIYQDLFTSAFNTNTINWSSSSQKLELLKLVDNKIEDTSERELSKYKYKYSIVAKLLEYSKTNKLYTAFAKKMYSHINPITNRIHTDFFQILSTGRVSSNKPNLQQIPSRSEIGAMMRSAFIPREGFKMVGGDFAGCELRIIAEYSQDPIWLNAFKEGKDLHSELCAATFNIPIEDVKKPSHFKQDIKYRDIQKTLNFG